MTLQDDEANVVIIPEDVEFSQIRDLIEQYLALKASGPSDFILLNFGWRALSVEQVLEVLEICSCLNITLDGIISFSSTARNSAESLGIQTIIGRMGISSHYSRVIERNESKPPAKTSGKKLFNSKLIEETVMFRHNLKAGEVLEARGNVVIQGNIERGAQVIAAGDIVVLGAIKGEAHAGVKGNKDSQIICFFMEPDSISIAGVMISSSQVTPLKKGYVTRAFLKGKALQFKPYRVDK